MKMIIDTFKLIGSLFYRKNLKSEQIDIVAALIEIGALKKNILNTLIETDEKQLEHDFSVLFEGMGDMPVPPWGSVYLDRERVIFGKSTLEYRAFLDENGVEFDSNLREPEDQFGLMLLAYVYLIESGKKEQAVELMAYHFLPWAVTYLNQLNKISDNLYYQELSIDIVNLLNEYIVMENINVTERKIYLNA